MSFQKKARIKVGQIQGTKPSLYNNQLLISTGIPSLDNVVGGGVAVGTVLLLEEDVYGSYARLMMKYFVAEGIVSNHTVFLSSASDSPQCLLQELPAPIQHDPVVKSSGKANAMHMDLSRTRSSEEESEGKMKIAWRYQSQPKLQNTLSTSSQFGHYYDLTRTMNTSTVEAANVFTDSPNVFNNEDIQPVVNNLNVNYITLLKDIKYRIQEGKFGTEQQAEKRNILRIGIHSLGSPLWCENAGSTQHDSADSSLTLFLIALKATLRSALAVAMVTVPTHLFHDKGFVHRVRKMCDTVVRLESFAGSEKEKNPVFKDYHGLFHLVQLPRINSLIPPQPETSDLAFKLRRKKFTIERLHLPPELMETSGHPQKDDSPLYSQHIKGATACGSSTDSKLSF